MNPLKELPFTRGTGFKSVIMDLDIPDVNPSTRFKFLVKDKSGKYIARSKKPGQRYELSDKPFTYYSEVESNEAKRSFKGATLIKEEAVNN